MPYQAPDSYSKIMMSVGDDIVPISVAAFGSFLAGAVGTTPDKYDKVFMSIGMNIAAVSLTDFQHFINGDLGTYPDRNDKVMMSIGVGQVAVPRADYLTWAGGAPADTRPKVFLLNDTGTFAAPSSTDLDNQQILPMFALYSDVVNIRGIGCTWPGVNRKASVQKFFTDVYAADYPIYSANRPLATLPATLAARTYQGANAASPAQGWSTATELSTALIAEAHLCSPSDPLWVDVGGAFTDLAQAMHDDPTIAPNIAIFAIGPDAGFNLTSDPNSVAYIKSLLLPGQAFADTLFIACQNTLNGVLYNSTFGYGDRDLPLLYARGHGAMGDWLGDACMDSDAGGRNIQGFSAGDLPMLWYQVHNVVVQGTGNNPAAAGGGWGGKYVLNAAKGNRYYEDVAGAANAALTTSVWRTAWVADIAARFDQCCTTPPTIIAAETFQDITSSGANTWGSDLAGRPLKIAGTWANAHADASAKGKIVYVDNAACYITAVSGVPYSLMSMAGVAAPAGSCELEFQAVNIDILQAGWGGSLALTGDLTTGKRVEAFYKDAFSYSVNKEINGTPSAVDAYQVVSGSIVPAGKKLVIKLRRVDNGNGTYTYTLFTRVPWKSWVTSQTWTDSASVITDLGTAGIRFNTNSQIWGAVFRTIPACAANPVATANRFLASDYAAVNTAAQTGLGRIAFYGDDLITGLGSGTGSTPWHTGANYNCIPAQAGPILDVGLPVIDGAFMNDRRDGRSASSATAKTMLPQYDNRWAFSGSGWTVQPGVQDSWAGSMIRLSGTNSSATFTPGVTVPFNRVQVHFYGDPALTGTLELLVNGVSAATFNTAGVTGWGKLDYTHGSVVTGNISIRASGTPVTLWTHGIRVWASDRPQVQVENHGIAGYTSAQLNTQNSGSILASIAAFNDVQHSLLCPPCQADVIAGVSKATHKANVGTYLTNIMALGSTGQLILPPSTAAAAIPDTYRDALLELTSERSLKPMINLRDFFVNAATSASYLNEPWLNTAGAAKAGEYIASVLLGNPAPSLF